MRIAYISPWWPKGPKPSGIVTYLSQITELLRLLGHEVFVVTWHYDSSSRDENVIQIASNERRTLLAWCVDRLLYFLAPGYARYRARSSALVCTVQDLLDRQDIDIVQIEDSFGWARAIVQNTRVPVVVRLHGPYFLVGKHEDRRDGLYPGRLEREGRGIRSAQGITSPTKQVMDATYKYYSLAKEVPNAVIHNPVMLASPEAKWSLRECDPHNILFVGRTDKLKGGDLVLKVFENLLCNNPSLTLDFVGPDRGFDDSQGNVHGWDQYLSTFVSEKARARVRYHGPLTAGAIMPLRRRAFMTLVFSRYENFPNVCTEAFAFGCPLVATNVGGIPEIVRHGYNGLLADPDNMADLMEKVQYLLDHPEEAVKLGNAGWETCKALFDPETIAQEHIRFYEAVLTSIKAREANAIR